MSILAYSELMKRIAGIDEHNLETPFIILNRNNTTPNRLKVLKALAAKDESSLGKLLKHCKMNRGGGSYLTIKNYFRSLEDEGLLQRKKELNREIWSFSKKYEDIKKFILNKA